MEKIGLALSGGGSKGAYEAGVYKALRKLHIKIDIVTGTSIGAVNGMLIVQKNNYKIRKFWRSVSFSKIYKEEEFPKMDDLKLSKVYSRYAKAFINNGGLDISKMEKMFDEYYNAKKFFKSEIDFGVVTYNMTKRKPVIKKKKDLNEKSAKDYIIASASCYPAFKPYKIGRDLYIDGGYYDNLPINLAAELGATKIIAVDLRAVGLKKKVSSNIEVTTIAPRNKIVSFLIFDKQCSKETFKYGYNDAMKTFKQLDGNIFTFRKNSLIKNYNKYNDLYEENLNLIFKDIKSRFISKIVNIPIIKEVISRQVEYNHFNEIVEAAGKIFEFPEYNIYSMYSYNSGLISNLENVEPIDIETIKEKAKKIKINKILDSKKIVKYFYNCITNKEMTMIKYIVLFKNEFLTALYIYTIKNKSQS